MRRYVIDTTVVLHLLDHDLHLPSDRPVLAPSLLRDEVLETLFQAVNHGRSCRKDGLERLDRFATMKVRYLGD